MRWVWEGCGVATWLTSVGSAGFLVQEQLPESSPIVSPYLTPNMKGPAWKCPLGLGRGGGRGSLMEKEQGRGRGSRSHSVEKASNAHARKLSAGSIQAWSRQKSSLRECPVRCHGRHTCARNRHVCGDRATGDLSAQCRRCPSGGHWPAGVSSAVEHLFVAEQ